MKFLLRAFILLGTLGLLGAAAAVLVALGAYIYVAPELPSVDALKDVQLQVPLRVYSRDGRLLAEFGEKRRTPVSFEEIPERVVQAFTAAEDDRFFEHPGVDYQGLVRAAWGLATTGERRQGGSTITMQVARNFFLSPEKTIARKVREIFLALKIERELSKKEILTLYLNKIFLGQRAWGVSAAAEVYFGRPLSALSLAEIATIAGLPKAPSTDNPVTSPERAMARRMYVLRRMRELDHIDDAGFFAAAEAPVHASLHGPQVELEAPYVAEMVRASMLARYGADAYTAGYSVRTTLDSRLQESAARALRRALHEYDRRHGWRGALDRRATLPERGDTAEIEAVLDEYPRAADLALGLVLESGPDKARVHVRRHGPVELTLAAVSWAKPHIDENNVGNTPKAVTDVLAPGDVIYLRRDTSADADGEWGLSQLPDVQGAIVSMDPQDGAIVALSGGYDFFTSKFNRAMQAQRQPGSSFKPFVYSAALENGYTPATLVPDSPVVFEDANLENTWRPENYSREFHGLMRLREALIKSRNLISIRVLRGMGIDYALDYLQRFGFLREQLPRDLSLALGSAVFTPVTMASAYSVLASGGFRTEPYFIEQIRGAQDAIVFEADPPVVCAPCTEAERIEPEVQALQASTGGRRLLAGNEGLSLEPTTSCDLDPTADIIPYRSERLAQQVISAQNAYLISDMMRDVIRRGTGVAVMELGRSDLSGKTGTTNEQRDAWFSGFNADLATVTWVGFDQVKPLGRGEVGGRAALPAWKYYMSEALKGAPEHIVRQPSGIIRVKISPTSGLLARSTDSDWIYEIFRDSHVPAAPTDDPWQLPGDSREETPPEEPLF